MKTEDEIRAELELVNNLNVNEEVNAMSQALSWIVDENVMSPAEYLNLSGDAIKIHI